MTRMLCNLTPCQIFLKLSLRLGQWKLWIASLQPLKGFGLCVGIVLSEESENLIELGPTLCVIKCLEIGLKRLHTYYSTGSLKRID